MAAAKSRTVAHRFYTVKSYRSEESVGFLLGRCLNRITDAIDRSLADLGVNAQQFGILHAVFKGTARNPSELARLRFQNSAAITYTLDTLEAKKLLSRRRSAQDRRVVEIDLTGEGKALTGACIPLVVEAQNCVLRSLTKDDYAMLSALLHKFADSDTASAFGRTGTT